MNRVKLTKRTVEALTPPAVERVTDSATGKTTLKSGKATTWDCELKGFGVEASSRGTAGEVSRTFVFKYRTPGGQQRWMTLGRYHERAFTAEMARAEAVKVMAAVNGGKDPWEEKRREREHEANAPTLAEFFERYLEQHARPHKAASSVRGDQSSFRIWVQEDLGDAKLEDITPQDVRRLMTKIATSPPKPKEKSKPKRVRVAKAKKKPTEQKDGYPIAANRVLALLSKVFALAEHWGVRPAASNPCRGIQRFKENKRERFLGADELKRLGATLRSGMAEHSLHGTACRCILLLLLTGCRRDEVRTLRWEHMDLKHGVLRLPNSKTGARLVYLNKTAVDLLKESPREPGGWVFPGAISGQALVNVAKPWARICKDAGLRDVRLHDLRHTHASVAAGLGQSLPVIGKLLGHTQQATTQRYAHLADDPIRAAVEQIGAAMEEAMERGGAKVVEVQSGGR